LKRKREKEEGDEREVEDEIFKKSRMTSRSPVKKDGMEEILKGLYIYGCIYIKKEGRDGRERNFIG